MTTLPDWTGLTVAIIATGPSVTPEQVEAVRAAGHKLVAVDRAFELVPDADLVVVPSQATAAHLWRHVTAPLVYPWPDPTGPALPNGILFHDPELPRLPAELDEISLARWQDKNPPCPACGHQLRCWARRRGAAAIEIVLQTGAARIELLGYDGGMTADGRRHFGDAIPARPGELECDDLEINARCWPRLARKAEQRGVGILNLSPSTRIDAFARVE